MKKILLIVMFCLWASGAWAAPAFVRGSSNAGSAITGATFSSNTAGNLLVVAAEFGNEASELTTFTDSKGNVYTEAYYSASGGWKYYVWYAKNCVASAGANAITALNSYGAYGRVAIAEYSGVDTTAPLRNTAYTASTGTAMSTGNVTTVSGDLVVGWFFNNGGTLSGPSGTQRFAPDGNTSLTDQLAVGSTTNPSITSSTSNAWTATGVAFIPAGAGTHTNIINNATVNDAAIN